MQKILSSFQEKKRNKLLILGLPVLIGIGLLLYVKLTGNAIHLWDCMIWKTFHVACPGCGGTRCVNALLRFDFLAAIKYNVVVFVYFFILAGFYLYNLYTVIRFNRFIAIPPKATFATAVILLAFGVIRNLPFFPWHL